MKSTTQGGLWTIGFGELGATLKALQDHGVTHDHLARLRADPGYAKWVAEFMLQVDLDAPINHKNVRAVMGKNFFGVEDWSAFYSANFNQRQLRQVAKFPWSEDILNSTCPLCGEVVKDCHFAFLGLDRINGKPLTILKWQELHPAMGQPKFHSYAPIAEYSGKKFAMETTMSFRWYLLHQNIVPKSEGKNYDDQKAMLTADYEVPSAVTEATKDLLVFRKTGKFVNSSRDARCKCLTSGDIRVVDVGHFSEGGLVFDGSWVGLCVDDTGLAASRKLCTLKS